MKRIVEFFQDTEGQLSMTRLIGFLLVANYIVQSSFIAYHKKEIADLPIEVALLVATLYGLNRANLSFGKPKQESPPQ